MSKAKDKDKKKLATDGQTVAVNRRARFDYEIEDSLEAGLVLTGTEVKSVRRGDVQIAESYAALETAAQRTPEAWLHNMHIAPYKEGNAFNPDSRRKRKLLLRRDQITKLAAASQQKGYTLVPLKLYFTRGKAKIEIGVAKGRKRHDKRQAIEERETKRDLRRVVNES
jgi:SsrA-binding protein